MKIDPGTIVAAAEANRDSTKVSEAAGKKGRAVVFQNDRPKYPVIDPDVEPQIEMTEDERITFVAKRILREHIAALKELAK